MPDSATGLKIIVAVDTLRACWRGLFLGDRRAEEFGPEPALSNLVRDIGVMKWSSSGVEGLSAWAVE